MSSDRRYAYKPRVLTMLFATAFFAVCTAVIVNQAVNNDAGLVIERFIELSTDEATPVLWVLAGLSALLTLAGLFGLMRGLGSSAEIVLTDRELIVPPAPLRSAGRVIPLAVIRQVSTIAVGRQRFLRLTLPTGKLDLAVSHFGGRENFADFSQALNSRLHQS